MTATAVPAPAPDDDPLRHARRVLTEEAEALHAIAARLDHRFVDAVRRLRECEGRVVVTGMGKSGHIGNKIAATLASLGTPAFFLHPAEALHGDLGMVTEKDVVLALSYSGETDELRAILVPLKRRAGTLIAVTGNAGSSLAKVADVVLDVNIGREACAMNLAPTTSTTAMLALGDALAVTVMEARGFGRADYAKLHPAGSLGRRLLLRIRDVMRTDENVAILCDTAVVRDVVLALPRAHQSAAIIVGADGRLAGLITGGDLRRGMERFGDDCLTRSVTEIMTRTPLTVDPDSMAVEGLQQFQDFYANIMEIPVVDGEQRPVGMLMLKDLLRAGIVLPDADA